MLRRQNVASDEVREGTRIMLQSEQPVLPAGKQGARPFEQSAESQGPASRVHQHDTACIHPRTSAERSACSRRVKSGEYLRVFRGLYAQADTWNGSGEVEHVRLIARSLADMHPQWVFCHFTAAAIYGLEIGRDLALPLHVQMPRGGRKHADSDILRHQPTCSKPTTWEGVRVTPPAQTVIDCLLELPFARGLAIADSALRVLGLTKELLTDELNRRGDVPRRALVANVVSYADSRAANGGESVARAVMIEQGFMLPDLQFEVHDPLNPKATYYVDYRWHLATGDVFGELDGKDKYVDPEMTGGRGVLEVMVGERHREARLTTSGARVLRFTFRDAVDAGRLCQLLELYGIPRGPARVMDT